MLYFQCSPFVVGALLEDPYFKVLRNEGFNAFLEKHLNNLEWTPQQRSEIPEELKNLLEQCMQPVPEKRVDLSMLG